MSALPSVSSDAYVPSGPFTAATTSSLLHDTITANTIPVYNGSPTPLAAFVNPNTGFTEALVISVDSNDNPVLAHITRSASGETGWTANPLGVTGLEVAAGMAYANWGGPGSSQVYGFYHDGTNLYGLQLNSDNTWSSLGSPLGSAITGLKMAYAPSGVMVLYGRGSDSNLVTYSQAEPGVPFANTDWGVPVSSDVQMILDDKESGANWQAASIVNGTVSIAMGVIGDSEPTQKGSNSASDAAQIVMGFWSKDQNSASFLYLDTAGTILNYCGTSVGIQQPGPSPSIATATGVLQNESDGLTSMHLYSVDSAGTLWVLHQDPVTPYVNGAPNFTGFVQLAGNVGNVMADRNPADAPTLFAVDMGVISERANSVRMHRQDPQSRYWFADNMFTPQTTTFDVDRFRSEVSLFDSNGIPVSNYPVSLTVPAGGSSVEVAAGGQSYFVTSAAPTAVQTDVNGRLTLAVMANSGLSTPPIIVSGTDSSGTAFSYTIEANRPIHDFLAGNGTLNPTNPGGGLPVFDAGGTTLGAATDQNGNSIINNAGNVPAVAQGVQQLAQKAVSTNTQSDLLGFTIDFRDMANPQYIVFTDRLAFDAHLATLQVGGFLSWLEGAAKDVVSGLESGVLAVANFTYDAIENVVNLVIQGFNAAINLTLNGLEDIAHAVASVFMWVVDEIKKVIAWLKALFDLKAIWRTKTAFQAAITSLIGDGTNPGYIVQTLANNAGQADGWFKQQQTQINNLFASLQQNYGGGTFGSQPGFAAPGAPSTSSIGSGSVSPSSCTSNVHHNWLHDKMSSGAPKASPAQPDGSPATAWGLFVKNLGESTTDFENGFAAFAAALGSVITDPATIATTGITEFLTGVNLIIDALLQLADAIVQGVAGMAIPVMTAIANILNTPIGSPFLQTIWDWVSGSDEPLTILSVMSLLAAFPATLTYILVTGSEPFPDSTMMTTLSGAAALPLAAAIMQILSVIPSGIALALGGLCPWYFSLFNFVLAGLIFFFGGGTKDLPAVGWVGIGAIALNIVWIVPAGLFVLKGMATAQAKESTNALGDMAKVVETLAGLLSLVFALIAAVTPPTSSDPAPSDEETAGSVLSSLPSIFALLQANFMRDGPYGGVATTAAAALLAVGCIGGGSAELLAAE